LIDPAHIRALLSLQFRALRNSFGDHARRKGLVASVLISAVWYGGWLAIAGICFVTPRMIGVHHIENALPGLLLFVLAYWQLSPLITLSLGVSLDMRKLAFYPTRTPTLFAVECLLRLWTGLEMTLVLVGLGGGLALGGTARPWSLAAAFALFLAFNVLLSAGMRNLVERIFRKRYLREIVLTLMVTCTLVPQVLLFSESARRFVGGAARSRSSLPHWATPAGLTGVIAAGKGSALDWLLLAGSVAVAGVFGYWMFRSSCLLGAAPIGGDRKPANRGVLGGLSRAVSGLLRLLPDPVGALVEKEIRYLWRSPRFRLPFFMGFTFAVIAWTPIVWRATPPFGDWMRDATLTLISLYSFLLLGPVLFLNRFGFDRGAARFYFWMPVTFRQMLFAKNLASAAYCLLEVLLIAVICRVVGFPIGWAEVFETLIVASIGLLWLFSIGNHMTVRFPIPSNPDRVSRGGATHGLAAAVQFIGFPLALTPIVAAYLVRFSGGGLSGFIWTLAAAAAAGLGVYWISFARAAAHGFRNREELIGFLSSGQGPITAE
jgi:ABC-2 type transport system permease protein